VRVRSTVGQEPWLGFSALGVVHLAGLEAPKPAITTAPPAAPPALGEAERAWDKVKESTNVTVLEAFAKQFGDTVYGALARARIDELKKQQVVVDRYRRVETTVAIVPDTPTAGKCEGVEALVQNARRCLKPKDSFKDCPECPEMVVIPAGEFMMGSPAGEWGRGSDEGPVRRVTIAKPFGAGRFEATFAEWDACVAAGGCKHKPEDGTWGRGKRPVINVSWEDAVDYVAWLSKRTGRIYRLLTEAEWEYAARAATTSPFSTGSTITTDQANFDGDLIYLGGAKGVKRGKAIEVGSLNKPNAFGLHDMHGNVWEWVQDCATDNYGAAPMDGRAVADTPLCSRVRRGGSWRDDPRFLRSANRNWGATVLRNNGLGFRVARTLD
jgi:formylglycine-generating enzyme required for sulfatase activity